MADKKEDINKNYFRHTFLDDKRVLLTNDTGNHIVLEKDDFERFCNNTLKDKKTIKHLEKEGFFLTDDNKKDLISRYRKKRSFLKQGPSLHIVILTLRCNQKCIYCHAASRGEKEVKYDMSKETAKDVVDKIFDTPSGLITIEFQGGEPTLNMDTMIYISELAKKKNIQYKKELKLTVVTNLIEFNDEILDKLIKNDIRICTSLDGPEFLHDKNRPYSGGSSYKKVDFWMKRIKEKWKGQRANALVTITKESLNYPQEIVDEYVNQGLSGIHLRFLNNLGFAKKNKEMIDYSAEEFIIFWKKALDYIIKLNKKGVKIRERGAFIILKKIFDEYDPNFLELRSPCGAVIGQLAYNYDGKIYSCDEGRMIGDDTFCIGKSEDKYNDIISNEKSVNIVSSSINDSTYCNICAFKPYCGICPVCSYAEQGTIIGTVSKMKHCKIYKEMFLYIFKKIYSDNDAKEVFMDWVKKEEL